MWEAWQGIVQTRNDKFWKQVKKRSVFNDAYVLKVVKIAESGGWKRTGFLKDAIEAGFRVVGGTTICEHGFPHLSNKTSSAHANRLSAIRRQYRTTIQSPIQSVEHRYKDLPWDSEPLPRGTADAKADVFFHPRLRRSPEWVSEVVGTSSQAPWYSPAPLYQHSQDADFALIEHYGKKAGGCRVETRGSPSLDGGVTSSLATRSFG